MTWFHGFHVFDEEIQWNCTKMANGWIVNEHLSSIHVYNVELCKKRYLRYARVYKTSNRIRCLNHVNIKHERIKH